jgi:hypothetical protein
MIDKGYVEDALVPAIARILRRPTLGFGHLGAAERPDLILETLVSMRASPTTASSPLKTIQLARDRLNDYRRRHAGGS